MPTNNNSNLFDIFNDKSNILELYKQLGGQDPITLTNGEYSGHAFWRGDKHRSLSINPDKNTAYDHTEGAGYNPYSLALKVVGSKEGALEIMAKLVNVDIDELYKKPKKKEINRTQKSIANFFDLSESNIKLLKDLRGIDYNQLNEEQKSIIKQNYQGVICLIYKLDGEDRTYQRYYPFKDANEYNYPVNIKNGYQKYMIGAGTSPKDCYSLGGLNTLEYNKDLWITEGLFDAISLQLSGFNAISKFNAKANPDLVADWISKNIGKFKNIYLALDDDKEGQKGVDDIVSLLPKNIDESKLFRAKIIRTSKEDKKDPNAIWKIRPVVESDFKIEPITLNIIKTKDDFDNVRDYVEYKHPRIARMASQKNLMPFVGLLAMELVDAIKYYDYEIKENIRNLKALTVKDDVTTYLNDKLEATFNADLEHKLMQYNLKFSKDAFYMALNVMMSSSTYCPFQDKLNNIEWDGVPRLNNAFLNKYFVDVDGIFGEYFRAFLVSAVGRVFDGQFQSPVWILGGKQGLGKSFFVSWLAKDVFGLQGYAERHINPDNKDDLAICCETAIIEIAEAISTFKKDREILKKHFTAGYFYFRNPYGRYNIQRPHLASYIATANLGGLGILKDPTGNRRFIICEMSDIKKEYSKEIDPVQLWAEATFIYNEYKEDLNLNYEPLIDTEKRDSINSRFASRPIEYDDLEEIIEYTGNDEDRLKPKDIIAVLQAHTGNKDRNILKTLLAEFMSEKYGLKTVTSRAGSYKSNTTNVYKGVKFKSQE
jgi:Virulence-associated protein E/Toprim-like